MGYIADVVAHKEFLPVLKKKMKKIHLVAFQWDKVALDIGDVDKMLG